MHCLICLRNRLRYCATCSLPTCLFINNSLSIALLSFFKLSDVVIWTPARFTPSNDPSDKVDADNNGYRFIGIQDRSSESNQFITLLLLVSVRRRWSRQRGGLIVYRWSFFSFYSGTDLSCYLSERRFFLQTHVSWLRVVKALLEFRISLLIISQGAKNRYNAFFTYFSLGDFTFSISAQ